MMAEHPPAAGGRGGGGGGGGGGGDGGLQDILRGRVDEAQRTKKNSNMIRVFISSTFTDLANERKALLENAYPEVLAFCCGLGLVFEVVDLCWGIRSVLSGDHEACRIFLQEIRTCKRLSAGPDFIALLGSHYGHRALPHAIPEKHFEILLSKLSKNPKGTKQLNQWFLLDSNAVPPTYVLQPITAHFPHYGDMRPENVSQRDNDVLSWRFTETQLLQALRAAATDCHAAGDLTAEQKHLFFTSVTEQEVNQGLMKDGGEPSALFFVRDTPEKRQKKSNSPKRFAKLMGLAGNGLLDGEAQTLLAGLKSRLLATQPKIVNLHSVELSKGSIDPKRKEHAQYLESVCEQFVSQMKARIQAAVDPAARGRKRRMWGSVREDEEEATDQLVEEVVLHATMSAELSRGLHGREGLLGKICCTMWESTNVPHGPLVVHGDAGMGKTALLCKLVQEMRGVLDARAAVVIRLLSARHPQRPDVDNVLRDVCLQVCLACGLAPPTPLTSGTHPDLIGFFGRVLAEVSQQGTPLLIVLDAVDQMSDAHHAHRLHWLPARLPPNVHILVSMETSSQALANARLKLKDSGSFFEVERLSRDEGKQVMESYLTAAQRTLTAEQSDGVLQSFEKTGSPLHLRLLLQTAKRWTSSSPLTATQLGANTQEMMSQLFVTLEEKHGRELVGGALGFITLAREGLLEAELRDVMSLDDDIISEVYRHSLPPTRSLLRLPPLLWARLRWDLEDLLEERWTGGVAAIAFNNRRVSEAVYSRYLTSERCRRRSRILAEYFLGRWSGRLKPVALPGLSLLLADRKVPPQPLWFSPGLVNMRKLQELPHHLLHAGLWDELRQEVIGSAEWLFWKSRLCGVSSVIQDLDHCSHYMDCTETGLVRDALVLIRPSLDLLEGHMDMFLFYTELLARLCDLATPFPAVIGQLCSQCEESLLTCPTPVLIPKSSFLQPPGGALQHTLTGLQGGVLCVDVSVEAELVVGGSDDGVVAVWSLLDQWLLHCLLGHTGPVLSVKVVGGSAHCFSLAADGLRRWSLTDGQQLSFQEAVPLDTSCSHLHLSDQLIFVYTRTQVKVWGEDGSELCSVEDQDSVVLGVLGECVVRLQESGLVTISHPVDHNQRVEAQLAQRRITHIQSVILPKHHKVLLVSKQGFLYQISKQGSHSSVKFHLIPSLLSVTENEKVLIAGCDQVLSLFHINTDSVSGFLDLHHDDVVLSSCMSSDGRLLVSGAADQLIRIWSVTTGALLDTLCGSDSAVTSLSLYKGVVVSASSASPSMHLWSLKYNTDHKPTAHIPAGCAFVAVTRDADNVFYVQDQDQAEVTNWDNITGCVRERLPASAEVCCLEVVQVKRLLLCGLVCGTVLIYPLALPLETLCIPPPESLSRVRCLAVSPQEKQLAVAYEDSVCLFDITSRGTFPTVEGPLGGFPLSLLQAPPSSMALLGDGRLLYGTACGAVTLRDFSSGSGSSLEPHGCTVTCVVAGHRGGHALVGAQDAVLRLWSLGPPVVLEHTMVYKGFYFEGVVSAAFSDNDQFVFTGSQDGTVQVWDVSSGNLLYVQFVSSPVVRIVSSSSGFVALTQQGCVIKELFRCPDHVGPDHNPLRNIRAQCRVTSRDPQNPENPQNPQNQKDFNPEQFNPGLMLAAKPSSSTCVLL